MNLKIYFVGLFFAISFATFGQADTWSVKFSDAIVSRYQPTINTMTSKGWEYSNGIILHGMEKVYLHTLNATYLNYIKAYVDAYVDANGNVTGLGKTVDKIQPGVLCLFLYEQTGQLKYKTAATNILNYMHNSANFYKTPDGGYWHKSEGTTTDYTYYNVMMVDGMYMLHPFLAKYASMFNQPALYDEVTFQLLLLGSKVMYAPRTLPKHAWEYYDYKTWSDPTTHESTDVWSRGTGWYMMALVDVLQYLPTSHPNYAAVLELFQRMSSGVAANQNAATGLWYQVVDKPTYSGNWTESSGSGMFVYALKKGVENGWLNSATYTPVINLGWAGMQTQIGTYTDGKPQIKNFCVASGVVNNTAAYISLGKTSCPVASGTQHPHGYCGILMAASAMEFSASIPVTGITVSPVSVALTIGGTQQLTATVTPADATNKNVTWTTSNASVATVSTTGLVTAIGAGTATITATTQDGGFTATSAIISSNVAVTGVTVSPASASLSVGATTTLTATIAPANATNKTVTWSSDNPGVASVNASGVVTAVTAGSAIITATTQDGGFTATSLITSSNVNVTGVTLSPASAAVYEGATTTLTANVLPANATNKNVSWSSDNTSVATVNATGVVTGVSAGSATITVTTDEGSFTATSAITVNEPVVGSWVEYQAENGTWISGTVVETNYTGYTGTGFVNTPNAVGSWLQLNVIVPSSGSYDMRVRYANGTTTNRTASVNVNGSVVISSLSMAGTGSWSTWAQSTFTVTLNSGSNTIRFTSLTSSGLANTDRLDVFQGPIPVTGVTVTPTNMTLGQGGTGTITASVLPTYATNKIVTWSSNNTSVATVNASGLVTGVSAGSATITVTTQDGGFTANCAVTVTQGCTATGYITFERWNSISGTAVSNLTSNANYPNSPSSTTTRTLFEIPTNAADNYGCRVSGYICAPLTGSYTFWIAGDDNVELWLSTSSNPANKVKIAYHTGYTSSRQWTKFTTQKSAVINLSMGVTYYIEALMKEGTGGDNLAVGWLKPGQTGTVPSEVIPGSVLSPRTPLKDGFDNESIIAGTEETIIVYPNPANDKVTLLVSDNMLNETASISIISMSGQVMLQQQTVLTTTETLDLSNLLRGFYIIRIATKQEIVNKRISVVK